MTSDKILDALNGLDGRFIQEARAQTVPVRKWSGRRGVVLIAAVVALMALAVTAFASEAVGGWLRQYFSQKTGEDLSQGQIQYIEDNEQVIGLAQEQNGWTVELRSTITDGRKAYIIIGITAPEDVNLNQRIENDCVKDRFGPGNAVTDPEDMVTPSVATASIEGNYYYQIGQSWREDGDGLPNTKNLVITLNLVTFYPDKPCAITDPFAPDISFTIHIEDIVREYDDEEYLQKLLNGKYAGQTDIMFTNEETRRLNQVETLVEGTWDFTVSFAENADSAELLSGPISIQADIWRNFGESIEDYAYFREDITVTSVVLRPLTVTLCYEDCDGAPCFLNFDSAPCVVMNDGSRVMLSNCGISGLDGMVLEAETPIVVEDVAYILMPDGTRIPMSGT